MWRNRGAQQSGVVGGPAWYRQMGQRFRKAVGGASLRDQCVEAIKRDLPPFLDRLPDLPADLRQLLLPAFLKARMLDSGLLELCTRHGLHSLDLSKALRFDNSWVDTIIANCQQVEVLNMSGCLCFSSNVFERFTKSLPHLDTLILDSMAFRANHTQELFKNGTNLRKLSMNFCTVPFNHRRPFDRDPLDGLHLLSNLECLSLSDLKYEDDPEPFSSTPNLSISAREIECFLEATAGRLRSLDLSYNKFLPTEPNLQAATNLIELHIAGQEFCNPAVFKTFLESVGPNLRCLSLGGSNLPEFTICELVGLLPHLEKLDLRKKSLSHTTVRYIGKCCPELQMLNLRLCGGNIQPESFFDDKRCVFLSLRELDIVGCSTVLTGEAEIMWQWQPWIADLPTLEILWISWNLEQLSYVRSTYPFFNRVQVLLAHQA